jgi:hypothetical protein
MEMGEEIQKKEDEEIGRRGPVWELKVIKMLMWIEELLWRRMQKDSKDGRSIRSW